MKVLHLQENKVGRDFATGDVHGCFDKLRDKLTEIGFDETKDRLFSVGDLVDRGPQSEESIDWLAKPWFFAVRGNHEEMVIDYVDGYYCPDNYTRNGGAWMMKLPKEHSVLFAEVFTRLPIAIDIQVGNKLYGIVHAECPTESWSEFEVALNDDVFTNHIHAEDLAMWSRDRFNYKDTSTVQGLEKLYVGHTPLKQKLILGNVHYIDTGACFATGFLTVEQMY